MRRGQRNQLDPILTRGCVAWASLGREQDLLRRRVRPSPSAGPDAHLPRLSRVLRIRMCSPLPWCGGARAAAHTTLRRILSVSPSVSLCLSLSRSVSPSPSASLSPSVSIPLFLSHTNARTRYASGTGNKHSAEVHYFDATQKTWTKAPSLVKPRHDLAAAAYGAKVFAFGGVTNGNVRTDSAEMLDTSAGSSAKWVAIASLPDAWSRIGNGPMPVFAGGKIIIPGATYALQQQRAKLPQQTQATPCKPN